MDATRRDGGTGSAAQARTPDRGAGWRLHQEAQIGSWCRATPAQRLAWLEEALVFARAVGALPERRDQPGPSNW